MGERSPRGRAGWGMVMMILAMILVACASPDKPPDPIASDYYYAQGTIDSEPVLPAVQEVGCPEDIEALTQQLYDVNKQAPEAQQLLDRAQTVLSRTDCQQEVAQSGLMEAIIYVEEASAGI